MFVCCDCCVLSGRGLCDELITRPEESYRLRCVVVCDLETSRMRMPWRALGHSATGEGRKCKSADVSPSFLGSLVINIPPFLRIHLWPPDVMCDTLSSVARFDNPWYESR